MGLLSDEFLIGLLFAWIINHKYLQLTINEVSWLASEDCAYVGSNDGRYLDDREKLRVKCSKWPKMSRIIYDEQTHLHLSLETRLSLQLLTFYSQPIQHMDTVYNQTFENSLTLYNSFFSKSKSSMNYTPYTSMYIRGHRIFQTSRYQGIVKSAVSVVFLDLKFKISEGWDQN